MASLRSPTAYTHVDISKPRLQNLFQSARPRNSISLMAVNLPGLIRKREKDEQPFGFLKSWASNLM